MCMPVDILLANWNSFMYWQYVTFVFTANISRVIEYLLNRYFPFCRTGTVLSPSLIAFVFLLANNVCKLSPMFIYFYKKLWHFKDCLRENLNVG